MSESQGTRDEEEGGGGPELLTASHELLGLSKLLEDKLELEELLEWFDRFCDVSKSTSLLLVVVLDLDDKLGSLVFRRSL